MSKTTHRVNGGPRTEKAQYSSFKEMFTPDWDRNISGSQERSHVQPRADMGNKETPRGDGSLRKTRS